MFVVKHGIWRGVHERYGRLGEKGVEFGRVGNRGGSSSSAIYPSNGEARRARDLSISGPYFDADCFSSIKIPAARYRGGPGVAPARTGVPATPGRPTRVS